MSLQESGEMYLETILILLKQQANNGVRSVDIGTHMGYSKPSVSRAVGILKKDGFIQVNRAGFITLTDSGRAVAEKIYERHTTFTELLVRLGVDQETAAMDACRLEHAISDKSFAAIKSLVKRFSDTADVTAADTQDGTCGTDEGMKRTESEKQNSEGEK